MMWRSLRDFRDGSWSSAIAICIVCCSIIASIIIFGWLHRNCRHRATLRSFEDVDDRENLRSSTASSAPINRAIVAKREREFARADVIDGIGTKDCDIDGEFDDYVDDDDDTIKTDYVNQHIPSASPSGLRQPYSKFIRRDQRNNYNRRHRNVGGITTRTWNRKINTVTVAVEKASIRQPLFPNVDACAKRDDNEINSYDKPARTTLSSLASSMSSSFSSFGSSPRSSLVEENLPRHSTASSSSSSSFSSLEPAK